MTEPVQQPRRALILIADDVESNYKLLEIILRKQYDLLWAKNGREAVDLALEHRPDAVLMDIKMPVMDGIEALKEIRRHSSEIPVIMQTAYAFDSDRRIAEEAGCNGFLTKPVRLRGITLGGGRRGAGERRTESIAENISGSDWGGVAGISERRREAPPKHRAAPTRCGKRRPGGSPPNKPPRRGRRPLPYIRSRSSVG